MLSTNNTALESSESVSSPDEFCVGVEVVGFPEMLGEICKRYRMTINLT